VTLENIKEWLYGCTHCGACKDIVEIFIPSCPAGERFQLESYFPSGQILTARAISEGIMNLSDDELRERIYACTGCLSCEQVCGVYHHRHIFEIVHAVRVEAVTRGYLNPGYMVMIDSLKREDNVFGKPKSGRGDWAKGLKVKEAGREPAEVLYHAGCMLSFEPDLREVPRSVIEIMNRAGVDIGIMGREENCCGARPYETGYLGEFTKYAEHSADTFNALGVKKVVTSCSDGYAAFKNLYPALGIRMNFEVQHVVEYLEQLIGEGKLKPAKKVPMKVTYHDPCHLGRHLGEGGLYDAPRNVLGKVPGLELVEMTRSRENSWCCGAGAGVSQSDPDFAMWTAGERLLEAKATGAEAIVTGCPWCEKNFKDAAKKHGLDIKVYDIAEIIRKAI
jgi:Fe-S oxidoreductase